MNFDVQDIGEWLKTIEWYDNHTLQNWLDCRRKAYWNKLHPSLTETGEAAYGLEGGIGNGGRFGSAIHSGLAAYYTRYGQNDALRRDSAFRAFDKEYTKRIGDRAMEESLASTILGNDNEGRKKYALDSKHRRDRGLLILDEYFDKFQREDVLFKPVDAELGFIVRYDDPTDLGRKPFWYIARIDGLFERVDTGDWFVLETKTTGGGAGRECKRLTFNRQPVGYVVGLRQFPDGKRIVGFLANAILVAAQKIDFQRQFFPVTRLAEEEWKKETFNIVQEIREAKESGLLERFYKNTGHCTAYGQCAFWDLCDAGLAVVLQTPSTTDKFLKNTWHPFRTSEEDQ